MGSRYYHDKKRTVESCHSVSMAFFRRNDYLSGNRTGGISWTNTYGEVTGSINFSVYIEDGDQRIRFFYTNTKNSTGDKTDCDYIVQLETTPCNLGGVRYWFLCPLTMHNTPCGRRVGILYSGGVYLGCRHCYNLSYDSRNDTPFWRPGGLGYSSNLDRKIEKLRSTIKHWTYNGVPTRRVRKYQKLIQKRDNQPPVEELMAERYGQLSPSVQRMISDNA